MAHSQNCDECCYPTFPASPIQSQFALSEWLCAQEGGKHWERSRGEIEALVASGQPLPADLQAIVDKRWVTGRESRWLGRLQPCHTALRNPHATLLHVWLLHSQRPNRLTLPALAQGVRDSRALPASLLAGSVASV